MPTAHGVPMQSHAPLVVFQDVQASLSRNSSTVGGFSGAKMIPFHYYNIL